MDQHYSMGFDSRIHIDDSMGKDYAVVFQQVKTDSELEVSPAQWLRVIVDQRNLLRYQSDHSQYIYQCSDHNPESSCKLILKS